MEPVIRALILKRFRSIPSERVDLENPTFLVGRNGSGKSNVVDAFAFLAEAMVSPLQAVLERRGGLSAVCHRSPGDSNPLAFGLHVRFGRLNSEIVGGRYAFEVQALPSYGFRVIWESCEVTDAAGAKHYFERDETGTGSSLATSLPKSNVTGLNPRLEPTALGLPIIGGHALFSPVLRTLAAMRVYSLDPGKMRGAQDAESEINLRSDGSNLARVLQEIERQAPGDIERISELLGAVVPSLTEVRVLQHDKALWLEFTQEWGERKRLRFDAASMSDGTLRALGLLAAVHQRPTPSLMVVEEPEATIHPGALGAILDILRLAGKRAQILVTTHSPEVLDAKWIEDRHLRIVSWEEGATRITGLAESSRRALQEHLMGAGELLRANALDAPPRCEGAPRVEVSEDPV